MKNDVTKFQTNWHVSKTTWSNEGIPQANKLFGKKILRNVKDDSPNVNENEIERTSNDECNNKLYTNPGNDIDTRSDPEEEYTEQDASVSIYIKDFSDEVYKKTTTLMEPNEGKMIERMILACSLVDSNSYEYFSCKYNELNRKK